MPDRDTVLFEFICAADDERTPGAYPLGVVLQDFLARFPEHHDDLVDTCRFLVFDAWWTNHMPTAPEPTDEQVAAAVERAMTAFHRKIREAAPGAE